MGRLRSVASLSWQNICGHERTIRQTKIAPEGVTFDYFLYSYDSRSANKIKLLRPEPNNQSVPRLSAVRGFRFLLVPYISFPLIVLFTGVT